MNSPLTQLRPSAILLCMALEGTARPRVAVKRCAPSTSGTIIPPLTTKEVQIEPVKATKKALAVWLEACHVSVGAFGGSGGWNGGKAGHGGGNDGAKMMVRLTISDVEMATTVVVLSNQLEVMRAGGVVSIVVRAATATSLSGNPMRILAWTLAHHQSTST